MKIGRIAEGIDLYISSWKSIDDPSQGNFTLGIDSSGLQVILKQGMAVKARSGLWNGLGVSGMPIMKPNTLYNFTYISNQREKYFTYELLNKSVISKMVLDESGKMELFTWNDLACNWIGFSVVPVNKCDAYALCGVNEEDLQLPEFDFATIAEGTNNFSINNKIGEGGFGPVYKGMFKDGQEIAVKRLLKNSRQGLDEFKNEVIGYMSAEYAIDRLYSVNSDVFSFGVMVLEIVRGRRNRGFYNLEHHLNLLGHAWELFSESRYLELIDTSIAEKYNLLEVLRSIHVGLLCVQRSPEERPSISVVVRMLDSESCIASA
ncbi:hypothetical protein GH714_009485 [Hevea brasiliensis]|uniref:Protein kinase domain-containing protein n=1 Tax=Hevea brasiliensis TaxID=3981 RepID=A0A6A6KDJ5_HEVBR|nr:hypothetical protein GH714_009485 [Hevea brasiliensis]